jgi:hypothetical protein
LFNLNQNNGTIEHRAGCTHPRAEHCSVGGRLMLGVMPGMFSRLRLSQSTDGKDAEHK